MISPLIFFEPFKNVKTILGSQTKKHQAMGQMCGHNTVCQPLV